MFDDELIRPVTLLGQAALICATFVLLVCQSAATFQTPADASRGGGDGDDNLATIQVEVKIGFLVGSRRLEGRNLKYAFKHAIDKINQQNYSTAPTAANSEPLDYNQTARDYNLTIVIDPASRAASPVGAGAAANSRRAAGIIKIKFVPIIRETFGSESESVKQTIALITKHGVNFILGPQETCQIEPKLASIFNVAMISHYCTIGATQTQPAATTPTPPTTTKANQPGNKQRIMQSDGGGGQSPSHHHRQRRSSISNGGGGSSLRRRLRLRRRPSSLATFIQIKPPHWKIVSRVVALIEQLLAVSNNGRALYPQQLVLLYFKEPADAGAPQPQTTAGRGEQQKQLLGRRKASAGEQDDDDGDNNDDDDDDELDGDDHLAAGAANDARQYKLIGELLEIKLDELIGAAGGRRRSQQPFRRPSLSTLNWHTTFHYGYTRNPFRRLLRRHFVSQLRRTPPPPPPQQQQQPAANQSAPLAGRCNLAQGQVVGASPPPPPVDDREQQQAAPKQSTEAIYIVVGHNYEHLGLMLALDELGLLATSASSSSGQRQQHSAALQQQQPMPPLQQAAESLQSGAIVGMKQRNQWQRRRSVVIGVDTEPYDESDDSDRFFRGLLMDNRGGSGGGGGGGGGGQGLPAAAAHGDQPLDLNSVSAMYRSYLGVVPAKPAHLAEFLDEMRSLSANQTEQPASASSLQQQQQQPQEQQPNHRREPAGALFGSSSTNQTTTATVELSARLLPLVRLPVEAFYLYDSVMLVGLYLQDCLREWALTLEQCTDGRRAFEWFRGRDYLTHVTHNWTSLDSSAQAEGSYNLIMRKQTTTLIEANSDSDDSSPSSLVPIGYFSSGGSSSGKQTIELHLNEPDEVDPIWLPFWCHVKNSSVPECLNLSATLTPSSGLIQGTNQSDHWDEYYFNSTTYSNATNRAAPPIDALRPSNQPIVVSLLLLLQPFSVPTRMLLLLLLLLLVLVIYLVASARIRTTRRRRRRSMKWRKNNGHVVYDCRQHSRDFNAGWYDETDERNFLDLVHKYLKAPEAAAAGGGGANSDGHESMVAAADSRDMVELHCNMFAFPSCRFVHWLMAMHQLKEMLFKFQVSSEGSKQQARPLTGYIIQANLRTLIDKSIKLINDRARRPNGGEGRFFATKHEATNSLRLLLNKYKSINECLVQLAQLDHNAVAKLYGVTMSCSVSGRLTSRTAYLIVEPPDRGSLRTALDWLAGAASRSCESSLEHNHRQDNWRQFRGLLISSLINDLLDGLEFIHESSVQFHGDLRATNCLISYEWRLKLSGFQTNHLRRSLGDYEQKLPAAAASGSSYFDELLYSAPELIQNNSRKFSLAPEVMRLADIYSFAYTAFELISGREPWSSSSQVSDSRLIVERVKEDASFRPALSKLGPVQSAVVGLDFDALQRTIRSCWSHSPERRPQSIGQLRVRLFGAAATVGQTNQPAHNTLMRSYLGLVEGSCHEQAQHLLATRRQILELKLRFLPANIVAKLCNNQSVARQQFECVSFGAFRLVLTDYDPNPLATLSAFNCELNRLLDQYRNQVHLLDSQADSLMRFMVYSGEPLIQYSSNRIQTERSSSSIHHTQLVASFALQLIDLTDRLKARLNGHSAGVQVRCGLHCGPALGGLLAPDGAARDSEKLPARYVLIGASMQLADTLERAGQAQRIQMSAEFRSQLLLTERHPSMSLSAMDELGSRQGYVIIKRESRIQAAGARAFNSELEAYWLLNGPRLTASQSLMLLERAAKCDEFASNRSSDGGGGGSELAS